MEKEEFERLYNELYSKKSRKLERLRKKVKFKIELYTSILLIIGLILFITLIKKSFNGNLSNYDILISLIYLSLFMSFFLNYKNEKGRKKYIIAYKNNIIFNLVRLVKEQLIYIPTDEERSLKNERIYKKIKFDNFKYNVFKAEDFIEGLLSDKKFIRMSNLNIYYEYKTKERTKKIIQGFSGVFAEVNLEKYTNIDVKILKNKKIDLLDTNTINMDSLEFENIFDVHTENRLEVMKLFTSDIMELLIECYNKYNIQYELILNGNKLYFRFFTGNLFEPLIDDNSMDKELLYNYYCILKIIVQISGKISEKINKNIKDLEYIEKID